ncbi:uncharacterized protein LOC133730505 [Rosa rugosa]|uniref:uncharacterized protein LOC133730505 n=1 Tax=Rosa rugosa TaxID=74645 RepID=UPI002B405BE9|nr:uncharacterized protein LOC133730505 [Rosa rugosa]
MSQPELPPFPPDPVMIGAAKFVKEMGLNYRAALSNITNFKREAFGKHASHFSLSRSILEDSLFQRRRKLIEGWMAKPIWKQADPRFVWNKNLLDELIEFKVIWDEYEVETGNGRTIKRKSRSTIMFEV